MSRLFADRVRLDLIEHLMAEDRAGPILDRRARSGNLVYGGTSPDRPLRHAVSPPSVAMRGGHMRSYGVTETAREAPADPVLALALEELTRNGFTRLLDALSPSLVEGLRAALDRVLAEQTTRFGGEAALAAIGDAGQARALLEEDDIFLEIPRAPMLDAVVETILGSAALVMQQNGIVIPPGSAEHHQQSWHRDLPYQSWVATKPIALGALAVLDDFDAVSGATLFLPGSHKHETFPSQAYVDLWATPAYAPAGSIVVFDAMCFHRGGVNRGDRPRRAINTLHGVPLLAQQIAFRDRPGLDPKLRRRLGLDYQPAASADEWRARRAARQGGKKPGAVA
jgi:ectoine hydroxylase-related dioxygenase (phytanoyl-CoA dioxygenase family)